jgi:alpha-D-xyloside xylohydrolase
LPGTWRLQSARAGHAFEDEGACQVLARELNEDLGTDPAGLEVRSPETDARTVSAEDSSCSVQIRRDPMSLRFSGPDGRIRCEIDEVHWDKGALQVSGPLDPEEKLYGGGQRFDSVNRRGRRIEVWAEDRWCQIEDNSYMPVPFTLSSAGYGWLVNRFEGMVIDLDDDRSGRWTVSELEAPLDLYVFVDDDPRSILESLTQLTGRAPVPPEWGFGMLVSRHLRTGEFSTPEGVREMAREMDEADLPWSGVIIEGWPTFDRSRYDELRELAEELHEAGKKVMVYETCGRVPDNILEETEGRENYCLQMEDGSTSIEESRAYNPEDAPDRRTSRWVDITDPEAWRWWSEEVWGVLLEEVGVDGAKVDFCEQVPEHDSLVLSDGRSPQGLHHYYPVKYNTLMYRLFNEKRPDGGLCWSRGGGIGGARYPWPWCGDQFREWRFLKAILRSALSSGLSGLPYMGHDLGGYMPARDPESNPESAVFARGCQLACFHPMMSTHGTVTRPYDFPPDIVDIYRLYSRIHYALIPYLVEQAREGCAVGLPLLRHLLLHAPGDERAEECEDQYFLGEDLLVAPVLDQGETRDVYLPDGKWEELFSGTLHEGPALLSDFEAPLDRIPAFVPKHPNSSRLPDILERIRTLWRER